MTAYFTVSGPLLQTLYKSLKVPSWRDVSAAGRHEHVCFMLRCPLGPGSGVTALVGG